MLFVIGWTDQQITNRSVRAIIGLLCRENHHKILHNNLRVGLQSMFASLCELCIINHNVYCVHHSNFRLYGSRYF